MTRPSKSDFLARSELTFIKLFAELCAEMALKKIEKNFVKLGKKYFKKMCLFCKFCVQQLKFCAHSRQFCGDLI